MLVLVILNTIIFCLDGLVAKPEILLMLEFLNVVFSILFIIEMVLKVTGIGIVKYLKDKMNMLDLVVVIISMVELILNFPG